MNATPGVNSISSASVTQDNHQTLSEQFLQEHTQESFVEHNQTNFEDRSITSWTRPIAPPTSVPANGEYATVPYDVLVVQVYQGSLFDQDGIMHMSLHARGWPVREVSIERGSEACNRLTGRIGEAFYHELLQWLVEQNIVMQGSMIISPPEENDNIVSTETEEQQEQMSKEQTEEQQLDSPLAQYLEEGIELNADSAVQTTAPKEVTASATEDNAAQVSEKPPVDLSPLEKFNEVRATRSLKQKPGKKHAEENVSKTPALLRSRTYDLVAKALNSTLQENDVDGKTHINVDDSAQTELGQQLSINAAGEFIHPELGKFKSIGGLWHYLKGDNDDRLRTVAGHQLRDYIRKINADRLIEGFYVIMAEAMWVKVQQMPKLAEQMAANELPYRFYRRQGTLAMQITNRAVSEWWCGVLEEITRTLKTRKAGQEDAQPDFSYLDRPKHDNAKKNFQDRGNNQGKGKPNYNKGKPNQGHRPQARQN